jgi:pantetheine-phosphate adenylyltransferase
MQVAVVPGSFDPVTLGHLDIVGRAARLVERLHVLVTHNPGKSGLLPFEQRVDLVRRAVEHAGFAGVVVDALTDGLLVDYCVRVGAQALVKGIRTPSDTEYEASMAIVNRDLAGIETVFLLADPATSHVSSSLVRQVASLGGDVRPYVPGVVADLLQPEGPRRG